MDVRREVLTRWDLAAEGKGVDLVGRGLKIVAVEAQRFGHSLPIMEHKSEHDLGTHRMETILEGGHDAEIPAATTDGPEKVAVLADARRQHAPVCGDDLGGNHVVAAQAVGVL